MGKTRDIQLLIERIAPTKSPVLFLGEEGTGKSYFAEYVHKKSSPSPGLFCAAPAKTLTPELLASIVVQKPETIYICEVSELSYEIQKKIVALSAEFPVRILACSSKNLETLTQNGFFLPDLYALLSVLPVVIPPLRFRKDDIIPLAQTFLAQYAGNKKIGFSADSVNSMQKNYWQGNVRELHDKVKIACESAADGDLIKPSDLKLANGGEFADYTGTDKSLKKALDGFKRQYLMQILAETNWNQTAAARLLDIQRTYLCRLMRELKIQ